LLEKARKEMVVWAAYGCTGDDSMTTTTLLTPKQAIARLANQQGISLTCQPPGTRIYLETTDYSYELTLLDQAQLKVEITSNDPRLGIRTVGIFERSVYDEKRRAFLLGRIVEGMRMQIRFANGIFCSRPVTTATVLGNDWHYKVF
jgi:hypothetical protein